MAVVFDTDRLLVRHLQPSDLDDYHQIIGSTEVMRYIRPAQDYEGSRAFLQQVISKYTPGSLDMRLAIIEKATGQLIGNFAVIPLERTGKTQIGYAFIPEAWGKGYATEVTRAGMIYAFGELGLAELGALAEAVNAASCQVLVKCGFELAEVYEENGRAVNRYIRFRDQAAAI